MKKILQIITFAILIVLTVFSFSKFQKYQKQRSIDKAQQEQKEGDEIYSREVLEESRKDPLFALFPIETSEFYVVPTVDVRYEYTVLAKISDKEKAKQAFLNWVKEKKLDISHLTIIYE